MKFTFLGTGSAFTLGDGNYHSNMLLESDQGKRLLIDCGSDARFSLKEQGFSYKDLDDVYISHLHADHVGGLEWLSFTTYFDPTAHRLRIHLSQNLAESLWHHVMSGGLNSIKGLNPNLRTFYDVDAVKINGSFQWEGVDFHLIRTIHTYSGDTLNPSYGLFFQINQHKIFLTTDAQFVLSETIQHYQKATIIFQDCETCHHKSGTHAHYSELVTLPPEIKQKMWLYHYQPGALPDAVAAGFLGFAKKGQTFHFNISDGC